MITMGVWDGQAMEADLGRRLDRRAWVGRVLELAQHLPQRDRRLLEQVYGHGVCVSHLAQLLGQDRKQTQRHIARLLRRIRRPTFRFVALHEPLIPRPLRPVARHAVILGQSQRQTARLTGRPLHQVRHDLQTLGVLTRLVLGAER